MKTINELEITVRLATAFMKNRITMEQLLSMTKNEVRALKGIGKRSVNDLEKVLQEEGLYLKEEIKSTIKCKQCGKVAERNKRAKFCDSRCRFKYWYNT